MFEKYKEEKNKWLDVQREVDFLATTDLHLLWNKTQIFQIISKYAYMYLEDMKKEYECVVEEREGYIYRHYKKGEEDVCLYRDDKLILITLLDEDDNVFGGLFTEVGSGPNEYLISDYYPKYKGGPSIKYFSDPMRYFIEKYRDEEPTLIKFLLKEYKIIETLTKIKNFVESKFYK